MTLEPMHQSKLGKFVSNRKNKLRFLLFVLIFFSNDTFLFGTNINSNMLDIPKVLIGVYILYEVVRFLATKSKINWVIIIGLGMTALMGIISLLHADPMKLIIVKCAYIISALLLTLHYDLEEYAKAFIDVMVFFAIMALVLEVIAFVIPSFAYDLPRMTNSANNEITTMIFAGFQTDYLQEGGMRAFGIFWEPGVFQIYLNLALMMELFLKKRSDWRRIIIILGAVVITLSTTGYLASAWILGVYFILEKRSAIITKKTIFIVLGALLVVIGAICLIDFSYIMETVFGKFLDPKDGSWIARAASVFVNLEIFLDHPLIGVGMEQINEEMVIRSLEMFGKSTTHNTNTLMYQFAAHGIFYAGLYTLGTCKFASRLSSKKIVKIALFIAILILYVGENLRYSMLPLILIFYGYQAKKSANNLKHKRKTKRLISINLGNFGSTGTIMKEISRHAEKQGWKTWIAYPERDNNAPAGKNDIIICRNVVRRINESIAFRTGYRGNTAVLSTFFFLRKLDKIKPDLIHLHNLHNNYIHLEMLFRYIKKNNIRVIWTLHDCWAFTGQCPHFTMAKCNKWKTGCYACPSYREYPRSRVDRTKKMWKLKKKWFTDVQDLTIVTPSQWLADLVKQSYLKDYPVKVIHNGIDLTVFKPTLSDFKEKYGIPESKKMILGVAFGWGIKKGLDVFIELAARLDPEKYQIVLVGTDENVDRKLPKNIISIHRTENQRQLAALYTVADVFVNPTREENFPTVNMESLACGTPVLTFRTGGSPEMLDETCGIVVSCDDVNALEQEIIRICLEKLYSEESCIKRGMVFDVNERYSEYMDLYK